MYLQSHSLYKRKIVTTTTIYMYRVSYILRMYTQKGVLVFLGFAFNLLSISGKLEKEKERKERKREKEKERERETFIIHTSF